MIDERDERLFYRAADALRAAGARDTGALEDVISALRPEMAEAATTGRGIVDPSGDRIRIASRFRRRPLVTQGAVRFIAGLAAGVAFAAGLGLGLFAGWRMRGASYRLAAEDMTLRGRLATGSATDAAMDAAISPVQFTLVAPAATRVALVGEFNDWDPAATPMSRASGGAWHVALPLARGRHVYAFVVDGSSWVADPHAPLAPERWFGASNSVMLVSGERQQ